MKKRIAILGSTGSIGLNALNVIRHHADRFEVVLLTAFNNIEVLAKQIEEFEPKAVAVVGNKCLDLRKLISKKVKIHDVEKDLCYLVTQKDVDIVLLAMTGAAALSPFLAAVKAGKRVAPANKEALVIAGDILMAAARRFGAEVIPVDSEQSAIFQALQGQDKAALKKIHLTASGGPLRKIPSRQHRNWSVKDILRHPRWKMGAKITVDSATLMNKGFEVIEAQRLFGLAKDQIEVLVHPEAIIHSMVEFNDGSLIAQLSVTDMMIPIQYALSYPERLPTMLKPLDLASLGQLTFERPDLKRFPSLALAFLAAHEGGTLPAVLNAADEIAVEAFLKGSIRFDQIYQVVNKSVATHKKVLKPSLSDIKEADAWARIKANELIRRMR